MPFDILNNKYDQSDTSVFDEGVVWIWLFFYDYPVLLPVWKGTETFKIKEAEQKRGRTFMKTKDHRLLGEFLLKNTSLCPGKKERTLFLIGCVEPDYNPFTYLLGFFVHPFRGHHAENSARYLGWLESVSLKRGLKRPLDWFVAGVALHYLADAFTFAHNSSFTGNLAQHKEYERKLSKFFLKYLDEYGTGTEEKAGEGEGLGWAARREAYLKKVPSERTDCHAIVGASLEFCQNLWAEAKKRKSKEALGSLAFLLKKKHRSS